MCGVQYVCEMCETVPEMKCEAHLEYLNCLVSASGDTRTREALTRARDNELALVNRFRADAANIGQHCQGTMPRCSRCSEIARRSATHRLRFADPRQCVKQLLELTVWIRAHRAMKRSEC